MHFRVYFCFTLAVLHKQGMKSNLLIKALSFGLLAVSGLLYSCSKPFPSSVAPGKASTMTNLEYGKEENAGVFVVKDYKGQPVAPGGRQGMIFIQGGRTVLGSQEQDVMYSRDNVERTVTIQSFYMDETEVANIHWLEYIFYLKTDSSTNPTLAANAMPDTSVWVRQLAYNDPYRDHYFRYPGFRYYPVVGVSWDQANDYCRWRSAKVNWELAAKAGMDPASQGIPAGGRIPLESGVVVPDYRLPSEAEWEYAAQALIGQQYSDENQNNKRLYPWDGHSLRNPFGKQMGDFLCNFKRGRGDYAGIAGKLNDGAMITAQVYEYPPNDYGLYNMAGNVNEWVLDVYRPKSFQDFEDLNPVRRNTYGDEINKQTKYNPENSLIGQFTNKDADQGYNMATNAANRHPRVYKGGSWSDVAYWCSPGTRRFWAQDSCSSTIGFRCAMIQAGRNY
jgi:gliding motility-associated lipoprotein GldJ